MKTYGNEGIFFKYKNNPKDVSKFIKCSSNLPKQNLQIETK